MRTVFLPQSGGCSGKLMVFHCGLPSGSGPGQLKDRLDQKLIGTDKEKVHWERGGAYRIVCGVGARLEEKWVGLIKEWEGQGWGW